MSARPTSLNDLHELIRDGRIGQDEALRLVRAWQQAQATPAAPAGTGSQGEGEALRDRVCEVVVEKVCELLKVSPEDLDLDVELSEYGLDSIVISQLVNLVNDELGLALAPTVLFEHPNLRAFSTYLAGEYGPSLAARLGAQTAIPVQAQAVADQPAPTAAAPGPVAAHGAGPEATEPEPVSAGRFLPRPSTEPSRPSQPSDDPIAIVGVSGRFPQAEDLDAFWRNLSEGRDCIAEVPADRWDWRAHFGDPLQEPGRTDVKFGGFMDGVADFDPLFFGIAPKEATYMDPQQRLLMLYVWKALEDAGYAADSVAGSDLGLFVGTNNTGYSTLAERSGRSDGVTPTGGVPSLGPNRMSYFLDVHGPSEPVETACSSALVAIHRGVTAIERDECGMAVVGGVNTIVVPDGHVSFSKAGMLSEDGRCKTFSDRADGYGRGEGVGMLVLKRLSAAERDGDHVYGLVRSTAQNHGGRANSLTAPNPKAQAALIRQAYGKAGIDPRTVGYIEAHGTGTSLGDPVEINGLKAAFGELAQGRDTVAESEPYCGLGSVKTNIGHLELASGVAGVIKVLLQMRHKTLVETLHCQDVNPYIDLQDSPFYLVRERQPWQAQRDGAGRELPRRAGVSSFGFGGSNAHVVLEEYVAPAESQPAAADGGPVAVVLSAREPETLRARVLQLIAWIDEGRVTDSQLPQLAYTLQVGRVAMEERLACVTDSLAELREKLQCFLDGGKAKGLQTGRAQRQGLWNELADDEDIATAIDNWMAKGKLGRLLKLWITGAGIDWRRLYTDRPVRRIPLPSYPFRMQRYWIADAAADKPRAQAAHVPAAGWPEHSQELHGSEYFLRDHRVQDVPTLPGVAYLELVREAYVRSAPATSTALRLRDVTWLRPLQVTSPRTVGVAVEPVDGAFEVHAVNEGRREVYARGFVRADPNSPAAPARHDIEALRANCPRQLGAEQCYARFDRMGLAYGPALRGIRSLHYGADLALGRLRRPEPAAAPQTLNTSMLDAALQSSVGLFLGEQGEHEEGEGTGTALPFAVREVHVFAATPAEGWAVVRRGEGDRREKGVRSLDIDLCDDAGEVCVRLLGFSTRTVRRAVPATPGTSETAETGETPETAGVRPALLIEPAWRVAESPVPSGAERTRHTVLCELTGGADPSAPAGKLAEQLGGRCETWQADGDIHQRYTEYAQRLLELIRDTVRAKEGPQLLQIVTPAHAPWLGGLSGMLRTARLEHPKLLTQWIEVDDGISAEELAGHLRSDGGDTDEQTVRHRDGQRLVSRWREVPSPAPRLPWRDGGTYLLTGGAGGLGVLFAEDIARRVERPTLVLCGRSPAGPAQEDVLAELRALGAEAEYRVLDVADAAAVTEAVRTIAGEHGALHGIVHAAGVLRDGFIARKSAEDLREVFAAKVAGLCHLDAASAELELDCFIGFSSMAAFGNVGQADYAAANAFMDGYATHRETLVERGDRSGRTLMVNWPLWGKGGMSGDSRTESLLESAGMRLMEADTGIDALHRAWGAGAAGALPRIIALEGDHARMREQLLPAAEQAPEQDAAEQDPAPRGTAAPGAPLAARIADLMAALLEIDPSELPHDIPLRQYGLDSIFLTQFLSQARKEFDESLTLDVIAGCETLQDFIDEIAGTALSVPEPAPSLTVMPEPAQEAPAAGAVAEAKSPTDFPELVPMNAVREGRPVFWVHHGNGGVESYAPVAARCGRPFYGIQPKGWADSAEILAGQYAMAEHYASLIRAVQPEGPYDIGGFSLGGLFAYEVVRQLQLQGAKVDTLVMLDTLDADSTNLTNSLMTGGRSGFDVVSKVSAFRAVNLVLGNNSFDSGEGTPRILHRDEADTGLDPEPFLDSLIDAAVERGINKTPAQLRARVRQLSRYFEVIHDEQHEVHPLPHPDELRCYYLRNRGGKFFGAFEDYMVLFPNPGLPPVDGTTYWREWADHIEDFFVIDVDTETHAQVMTEPKSVEKLLRLCDTLYAPEQPARSHPSHQLGQPQQGGR